MPGGTTLSRARNPRRSIDQRSVDLPHRNFLVRFCQGAGATLIPTTLWGLALADSGQTRGAAFSDAGFHLHPHYRTQRPLDETLLKVQPGLDDFITEKYADQIGAILAEWSVSLLRSPREAQAFAKVLAADFATSLLPSETRTVRSGPPAEVRQNKFS